MALNKRSVAKRTIGPAMQWTKRGGKNSVSQRHARNINIDRDAYRIAEPVHNNSSKAKGSKPTGNPVTHKKQDATHRPPNFNNRDQNTTLVTPRDNANLRHHEATAMEYYSGGVQRDRYSESPQRGNQYQSSSQFSDVPVWNSHTEVHPEHKPDTSTAAYESAPPYFTDTGAIRPDGGSRARDLSIKQYILPFIVVGLLLVLGIFASLG